MADTAQRIEHADAFFGATGAVVRHGGNSAHYSGATDHVQMPPFESFISPEAYYATVAHELTHWTKQKSRLAMPRKSWSQNLAQRFFVLILP
jgi:antirestriction protein ArdC